MRTRKIVGAVVALLAILFLVFVVSKLRERTNETNSSNETNASSEAESSQPVESSTEEYSRPTETETEEPKMLLSVREEITVEAGTENITIQMCLQEDDRWEIVEPDIPLEPGDLYKNETDSGERNILHTEQVQWISAPTATELRVTGAVYEIRFSYDEVEYHLKATVVDTTAPTILGVKNLSAYVGDSLSYKSKVTISDNSNEKIKLVVDSSKVDRSKAGVYTVTYSATDASGNTTSVTASVTIKAQPVINEETILPLADKVIASVTREGMSQWDQAYALWKWCRSNISYSYSAGNRDTLWTGAYEGFVKHKGDCYVYYATYAVLLDRVGIENMKVSRVGGTSNHWWNLVNVGDGWYHCDASPRTKGETYKCFMQTDEQLAAFMADYEQRHPDHPNYYTFDPSLYPERATKVVFDEKKL